MDRPKLHRIRTKTLGSLISILLFFFIFEIVLRETHLFDARISWSEPHTLLGWRHSPNQPYWNIRETDHPIVGRINRFGWRDRERSLLKPEGTYRIAVIGDSIVEALNVEIDSTFCALIEDLWNQELRQNVELMNFGRSGMAQAEEYLVLKNEVIQFSPDMVILFFLPSNDIQDISPDTAPFMLRPFFHISEDNQLILDTSFVNSWEFQIKRWFNPLKQNSALLSLLAERSNRLIRASYEASNSIRFPTQLTGHLSLCTDSPHPVYLRNYDLSKLLIKEMANYCTARNIRFMLVGIHSEYELEEEAKYMAVNPSFNAGFFDRDLRQFAASIGVDFLGLQEPFRAFAQKMGRPLLSGTHWNYEAHRLVADELHTKLETSLFLKDALYGR